MARFHGIRFIRFIRVILFIISLKITEAVLILPAAAYPQTHHSISGYVLDYKTKEPLVYANIFLEGTTMHQESRIEIRDSVGSEIVVNSIGYCVSPLSIAWKGYLAHERAAEWLPYSLYSDYFIK